MTMGQHTATHPSPPEIVIAITKSMTRWGALHPGRLRVESNKIVVSTRFGDHRPPAADEKTLQTIIESISALPPTDAAANLFVVLAKAQPFRGSKQAHCTSCRNSAGAARRPNLTVPFREYDPAIPDTFNELLARAYIFGEVSPCVDYMTVHGVMSIE